MTKQEAISKRCVQWMNDVIDIRNELYEPNDEMEQVDLDAIEDARYIIECIEKQIPKKPNKINRGTTTVNSGLCVNCLNTVFSYSHYCDVCGQAILWESDNE